MAHGKLTWVEQRSAMRTLSNLLVLPDDDIPDADTMLIVNAAVKLGVVSVSVNLSLNSQKIVYEAAIRHPSKIRGYQSDLITRGNGSNSKAAMEAIDCADQMHNYSVTILSVLSRIKSVASVIYQESIISKFKPIFTLTNNSYIGCVSQCLKECCFIATAGDIISNDVLYLLKRCLSMYEANAATDAALALAHLARNKDIQLSIVSHDIVPYMFAFLRFSVIVLEPKHVEVINIARSAATTFLDIMTSNKCYYYEGKDKYLQDYNDWKTKRSEEKSKSKAQLQELQREAITIKNHGNIYFGQSKYKEALQMYSNAVKICPFKDRTTMTNLYSNMAECCIKLEQYETCILYTTFATCISYKHEKSIYRRVLALTKLNDWTFAKLEGLNFVDTYDRPDYRALLMTAMKQCNWLITARQNDPGN